MNLLGRIGSGWRKKWRTACTVSALVCASLLLAVRRQTWSRPVRLQLSRQILFTGVDALGLTVMMAVLGGISVVAQAQLQLSRFGQSDMLGSILVLVIVREIGPLLVNFIVIGRSGTAIATELATMRSRHEVNVLRAQGVDPMVYLVLPRVLGVVLSVFCLSVIFVAVSFGSGYLFGVLLGVAGPPSQFLDSVLGAVTGRDVGNFFAKTILPGLLTGAICCHEGLTVTGLVTEVPQAATRGVVRSLAVMLLISAVVSVITYSVGL